LWIDAICINREDLAERSQQVVNMGHICSKAGQVRVWLGPNTEQNLLALQRLSAGDWPFLLYGFGEFRKSQLTTAFEDLQILPFLTDDYLAQILAILGLKYWSRICLVQELILAQRLIIQCGHTSVRGEDLESFERAASHIRLFFLTK
ncbi:hypothetical protein BU25DRAFT_328277, partial [Macroventuria anomochaeta]